MTTTASQAKTRDLLIRRQPSNISKSTINQKRAVDPFQFREFRDIINEIDRIEGITSEEKMIDLDEFLLNSTQETSNYPA